MLDVVSLPRMAYVQSWGVIQSKEVGKILRDATSTTCSLDSCPSWIIKASQIGSVSSIMPL